jgi:hypothetical protein
MWDLHNNIKRVRSISPIAIGTTGTGQTGKIVDRAGFEAVEFELDYGSITATNATISVVLKEGDVTGTMTSIADADLLGTESAAGIAAAATRTSGVSKNVSKRVGYKGKKRYVQVAKLSSTVTAGTPVAATVLLGRPRNAPVAT